MKTHISYILMVLVILSFGLLSVQRSEAAMPDAIDLGNINAEGPLDCNILDCNLLAIATDPNLLKKIDQRQNFNSDANYRDLLRKTLDKASKFIPYDVNKPTSLSDVNNPAYLTVSLCLADSRVYFWKALVDRDVIGWISIQELQEFGTNLKPKVTVWIVPRLDKTTSFTKNWNEHAKQNNIISKKELTKLALNIDILDANDTGEQLRGKVKVKVYENYNIKSFASGNILQTEIMLISNEGYGKILKPSPKPVLKMSMSTNLPFWPPKIEDIGKESPN